jgi:L-ascorbate metabolism protein UlaG (beta-lactamase superfamily)
MRFLAASLLPLILVVQHRPALDARFIGNMAFAISDGTITIVSDFPYQSGSAGYMSYRPEEIHSTTRATLALITHRHNDHWDPDLFRKTGWKVAGPHDVVSGVPGDRVVPLIPQATFGAARIEPIETPHARIGHYSYVVTWHDRRLYFSGDTEDTNHLVALKGLDVAFVSPWLYRSVLRKSQRIDAKLIVIYHHETGENVRECAADCILPHQGETIQIL